MKTTTKPKAAHTPDNFTVAPGQNCFYIMGSDRYVAKTCGDDLQAKADAELLASAPALLEALIECRDLLCSLNTSDGTTKLAYMSATDIPNAIKTAYLALQKAGHPNAQEGTEQ